MHVYSEVSPIVFNRHCSQVNWLCITILCMQLLRSKLHCIQLSLLLGKYVDPSCNMGYILWFLAALGKDDGLDVNDSVSILFSLLLLLN